jgi:vacuolar-type H+-ATPase catalytic subunit A/Vma1
MFKVVIAFHQNSQKLIHQGIGLEQITNLSCIQDIARMKEIKNEEAKSTLEKLHQKVSLQFSLLERQFKDENV